MTRSRKHLALLLSAAVGCAGISAIPAGADEVTIPVGQQGAENRSQPVPQNGVKKAQVIATYGEPLGKHGPTGEPPIYYWEYPDYIVYFEGDTVLHTVLKHKPASAD